MIRRETFLNKLHAIGYTYISQQKRTQMYRKRGGTHCIFVRIRDLLEEEFVASSLNQAGLTQKEIEEFIHSHRVTDTYAN